jgi:ATP adenylyltransferase
MAGSGYTSGMDRLWTPWRYSYVSGGRIGRKGVPDELAGWPEDQDLDCVMCNLAASVQWAIGTGMPREEAERAALIVETGKNCFVCLNRYPYSSGHVMVVPYAHLQSFAALPAETATELTFTAQRVETGLRSIYHPDGLNLGLNLGEAAGAGVAEHLHLHVLPRWKGDTNFMTTVADTRILPEELPVTWEKLRKTLTNVQPVE